MKYINTNEKFGDSVIFDSWSEVLKVADKLVEIFKAEGQVAIDNNEFDGTIEEWKEMTKDEFLQDVITLEQYEAEK